MNRVVHFEFQADNIERAKSFYEKVLGWKFTQAMTKDKGGMDYWTIDTGEGPGIGGGMYPRSQGREKYHLYDCTIAVENIDKSIQAVIAAGGKLTQEKGEIPGVGLFANCQDPEGNRFGLLQPTDWKPK